jgi:hypothetical protein
MLIRAIHSFVAGSQSKKPTVTRPSNSGSGVENIGY